MKLTVVIPNYNDRRVDRALASVFFQDYQSVEVIVVDGASPDPAVHRIYAKYPLASLISESDEGIFDALNKGVQRASGDVIYFMGSDDELKDPTTFTLAVERLITEPALVGVCIGCEFVNSRGAVIRRWYPRSVTSKRILLGIYPPHFSLFLKRELYDEIGLFDYRKAGGIAIDSLWLIDLAVARPNLDVGVLHSCALTMEYGGASTGSLGAIVKQFLIVRSHVRRKSLPTAFVHPWVKVGSKLLQLRPLSDIIHRRRLKGREADES